MHFLPRRTNAPLFCTIHHTLKLNNRDMPLFTQCVVDGDGHTEVVSLFIWRSVSREDIGAMLDVFKKFNEDWVKTDVIIGDKNFATGLSTQKNLDNMSL